MASPPTSTPITFSYAVGGYSSRAGMRNALIFSLAFTLQRALASELISALAATCDTASAGSAARHALGLGAMPGEDHTLVFVMNLPPHASIYLGPEGQLGGEAADRVAGFWRAIGIAPEADPDHLASLLALYAHLGAASDEPGLRPATRQAIIRRRQALLWEHLWPWVPAYTSAVESLGFILSRQRLAAAAATVGVGYRLGERRFALKAMLEQDPTATLTCLAEEADHWAGLHNNGMTDTSRWWAARAAYSAESLREVVRTAGDQAPEDLTSLAQDYANSNRSAL
jgi:hypothetical protein